MICPKCNKEYDRLLALSRTDNTAMICDECGMIEALEAAGLTVKKEAKIVCGKKQSAYEKTKAQVYATGNKWAIENFHATHD